MDRIIVWISSLTIRYLEMIACLKWVYKKNIQVVRQKGINVTTQLLNISIECILAD